MATTARLAAARRLKDNRKTRELAALFRRHAPPDAGGRSRLPAPSRGTSIFDRQGGRGAGGRHHEAAHHHQAYRRTRQVAAPSCERIRPPRYWHDPRSARALTATAPIPAAATTDTRSTAHDPVVGCRRLMPSLTRCGSRRRSPADRVERLLRPRASWQQWWSPRRPFGKYAGPALNQAAACFPVTAGGDPNTTSPRASVRGGPRAVQGAPPP